MISVRSAKLVVFAAHGSTTGNLTALTSGEEVPFPIQRFFSIADVPANSLRGDHAHKECEQFVFPVVGEVGAEVKDTNGGVGYFDLTAGETGLYVPAGLWLTLRASSDHACIGVLASHPYDPEDYIRSWQEFVQWSESD